jgi:hypothetical protein
VILHEFGHWLTGLVLTGRVPDFYVVAVRQKVEHFSTASGIVTWGAGPVVQLAVVWTLVVLATRRGKYRQRLVAMAGGAVIFAAISQLAIWIIAGFSSTDSWGNDLPKVASLLASGERLWMHLLSAVFFIAILVAARRWWSAVALLERRGMHLTTAAIGAVEGAVFTVVATLFVEIST